MIKRLWWDEETKRYFETSTETDEDAADLSWWLQRKGYLDVTGDPLDEEAYMAQCDVDYLHGLSPRRAGMLKLWWDEETNRYFETSTAADEDAAERKGCLDVTGDLLLGGGRLHGTVRRRASMLNLEPGSKWMTVQLLGSGWAAVIMWLNNEDIPGEVFMEPWETGIGRYETKAEAVAEAKPWAKDEGLEYVEAR